MLGIPIIGFYFMSNLSDIKGVLSLIFSLFLGATSAKDLGYHGGDHPLMLFRQLAQTMI